MVCLKKYIDDCIADFDFEKVHKVMEFLDWKWAKNDKVPDIQEMKEHVKSLFDDAVFACFENNEESYHVESGGFEVFIERYWDDKNKQSFFCKISFIAEQNEIDSREFEDE